MGLIGVGVRGSAVSGGAVSGGVGVGIGAGVGIGVDVGGLQQMPPPLSDCRGTRRLKNGGGARGGFQSRV